MEIIALPILIKAEPFQRVLVFISEGNDNFSDVGGLLLPDDNKVSVIYLRFDHRITGCAESVEIALAEDRYGEWEIFLDLCKWHLFNLHDPEREQRIKQALKGKMESTRNRENYSITDANSKK